MFTLVSSENLEKIRADPKLFVAGMAAVSPGIVSPVSVELEAGATPFGVSTDAGVQVSGTLEDGTAVTMTVFWVDELHGAPVLVLVVLMGEDRLGEIDDVLRTVRFDG